MCGAPEIVSLGRETVEGSDGDTRSRNCYNNYILYCYWQFITTICLTTCMLFFWLFTSQFIVIVLSSLFAPKLEWLKTLFNLIERIHRGPCPCCIQQPLHPHPLSCLFLAFLNYQFLRLPSLFLWLPFAHVNIFSFDHSY